MQSKELKVLSLNFTAWGKHSSSILHSGADVVGFQETRLSVAGMKQAENALKSRHESWHGTWGSPPCDIVAKTGNTPKTETGKSSHGQKTNSAFYLLAMDLFQQKPSLKPVVGAQAPLLLAQEVPKHADFYHHVFLRYLKQM